MFLTVFSIIGALLIGGGAVVAYNSTSAKRKSKSAGEQAAKILEDAQKTAKELTLEAKTEALRTAEAAKRDEKERRAQITQTEQQLIGRQSSLDQKLDELDRRGE